MNVNRKTNCFFSKGLLKLAACTLLTTGISIGQLAAAPGNNAETMSQGVQQDATTIKGRVVDEKGEGLVGVSILEKGTGNGTISSTDGSYTVKVKGQKSVLVFSYIGSKKQEVAVGNNTTIKVTLLEDSKLVDEVVVIGYGTQRKGDVTSAISSVKSEDFTMGKIGDAAELVKGKVAGLSITKSSGDPNEKSSIMLRGVSTLQGNVSPLVLVDGVEGTLTSVAPENISSIDVLKDASAAAIYGTRGANGVIIITTKSGKRESHSSITYTSYASLSEWYKKSDFMTTSDIIYGRTNFPFDGYDTDWLKAVTRKAGFTQNHSLSLNGGSQSSTYSANITYSDEQGIMRKSDSRNMKAQLDYNQYAMNDLLKFNVNVLYGTHKNTNNNNSYVYRQAMIHNPSSPIYNSDGSYYEEFSRFQYYNPVEIQNELIGDTRSSYARLTGNITFEPIKGWQTNLMLSSNKEESTSENYYTSKYFTQSTGKVRGTATKSSTNDRNDNLEFTSKYNLTVGKSRITGLVGYSYLYNLYDGFNAGNSNFPSESYLYNNIGQGLYLTDKDHSASMGSYKNDNTLIGFFGRATYAYDNRYNVMVSVRREGSSKFGENNKWGSFPAASVGWTLSNESFMKDIKWVNSLKLRSGYGITGVIPNDPYMSLTTFNYDPYGKVLSTDGTTWVPSLMVAQNPNPNLKWETTREINIGLDWELLNSRLSGSLDLYTKKTVDLLFNFAVPVPPNMYGETVANVGQMRNNGIELMVNAIPVKTRNFEWKTGLTVSHNENKLLSLSNDLYVTDNFKEEGGVGDPISVSTHCMEVGHRLGDFWGLKSVGVSKDGIVLVQVSDGNGGWVAKEFDSKYNEKANRQRLGNGLPQIYAGWNNTFRYKGFDLSLQFTGQFGFQILNAQRAFYENNSIAYNRLKSAADLHAAVDATGAAVMDATTGKQVLVKLSNSMSQGVWSDYIEKGDFIKLSSATLGYTFPIAGGLKKYIQGARLYLSGQNLFCITGYSGLDPEVSNYFRAPGIDDRDKYPTIRSYTVGLSINF
jgi:TonB-linked SusC/RagA family outer membrane protein